MNADSVVAADEDVALDDADVDDVAAMLLLEESQNSICSVKLIAFYPGREIESKIFTIAWMGHQVFAMTGNGRQCCHRYRLR